MSLMPLNLHSLPVNPHSLQNFPVSKAATPINRMHIRYQGQQVDGDSGVEILHYPHPKQTCHLR